MCLRRTQHSGTYLLLGKLHYVRPWSTLFEITTQQKDSWHWVGSHEGGPCGHELWGKLWELGIEVLKLEAGMASLPQRRQLKFRQGKRIALFPLGSAPDLVPTSVLG